MLLKGAKSSLVLNVKAENLRNIDFLVRDTQ